MQFEIPPSIAYHRRPDGTLFIYGQEVELVLLLARFFNFTINYQRPPPGSCSAAGGAAALWSLLQSSWRGGESGDVGDQLIGIMIQIT